MRLIAFSLTLPQLLLGIKDVTRRVRWLGLAANTRLMAVDRSMGLKEGESPVRIAPIRVVDVRRELLDAITDVEASREGFPNLTGEQFSERFAKAISGGDGQVTRIEFVPCAAGNLPALGERVTVHASPHKRLAGAIIGHVAPDVHPALLGKLVVDRLRLARQPPLGSWRVMDKPRAMVIKEDGKLSVLQASALRPATKRTIAADIVFAHTVDQDIRRIAEAAQQAHAARESECCIARAR